MSHTAIDQNRCPLAVAPPQRRVVHRAGAYFVPLRQTILLATNDADITPEQLSRPRNVKRGRGDDDKSPRSLTAVTIFAWPDSTLRELLEAVVLHNQEVVSDWLRDSDASKMQVKMSHVFPGTDRRPVLETIATLRFNGPVDAKADLVTMSELGNAKGHGFKAGDLLVFSKVVS